MAAKQLQLDLTSKCYVLGNLFVSFAEDMPHN